MALSVSIFSRFLGSRHVMNTYSLDYQNFNACPHIYQVCLHRAQTNRTGPGLWMPMLPTIRYQTGHMLRP